MRRFKVCRGVRTSKVRVQSDQQVQVNIVRLGSSSLGNSLVLLLGVVSTHCD